KFDAGGDLGGKMKQHLSVGTLPKARADAIQEIEHGFVLGRGDEWHLDMPEVRGLRKPSEVRQHLMFNSFAQHSAAQQEGVDNERVAAEFGQHHPDQTIITETISDRNAK